MIHVYHDVPFSYAEVSRATLHTCLQLRTKSQNDGKCVCVCVCVFVCFDLVIPSQCEKRVALSGLGSGPAVFQRSCFRMPCGV